MSYKVRLTNSAESDLNEIIDNMIENIGVNTAFKNYESIKERVSLLKISPEQGRVIPEFKTLTTKFREIIYKPWRIIYKIDADLIKVLIVLDGRRDIEEVLYEKLIKTFGA